MTDKYIDPKEIAYNGKTYRTIDAAIEHISSKYEDDSPTMEINELQRLCRTIGGELAHLRSLILNDVSGE